MQDTVFRQRISSIMTDNMYERRVRGRSRGDLDMKSLYKVGAGSRNVFTQKAARKGKQYNIVLAIDESGSMGRHGWGAYKIQVAADVAVFLNETFIGLNVNVAIVGFNGKIWNFQKFGQKIEKGKLTQTIVDCANADGEYVERDISCNHDYDGIAEAYKLLYGMKGTNLVIALSDGRPNCDHPSICGYDQDKHRTGRIRSLIHDNERVAKTIGIGVLYECEQFPERIEVHDLAQLKSKLTAVLRKEIKRQ